MSYWERFNDQFREAFDETQDRWRATRAKRKARRVLMGKHLPEALHCPVCGKRPDISQCSDWPKDCGPAPWYAVCYSTQPREHCVGGNGDNQREAVEVWNADVARHALASVGKSQEK